MFKAQNSIEDQPLNYSSFQNAETSNESANNLNCDITRDEIASAINRLKNNKSPGRDNVLNELLKLGKEQLISPLEKLFNTILHSGYFPKEWSFGYIIPLYKKGDESLAENYRGITLLSSLGKLFTQILNHRLEDFLECNNILTIEQAGFRRNHSTIDNILVLKSMIDKYVKSKKRRGSKLLFTCFVDFKKAFDSIPRKTLFEKISKIGVTGNFFSLLVSIYINDESAVKVGDKVTHSFN